MPVHLVESHSISAQQFIWLLALPRNLSGSGTCSGAHFKPAVTIGMKGEMTADVNDATATENTAIACFDELVAAKSKELSLRCIVIEACRDDE